METKYVVVDENGYVSLGGEKAEDNESFPTFQKAEKRAKELADCAPGQVIGIFELVGEVVIPLGKEQSTRKYPVEHYK